MNFAPPETVETEQSQTLGQSKLRANSTQQQTTLPPAPPALLGADSQSRFKRTQASSRLPTHLKEKASDLGRWLQRRQRRSQQPVEQSQFLASKLVPCKPVQQAKDMVQEYSVSKTVLTSEQEETRGKSRVAPGQPLPAQPQPAQPLQKQMGRYQHRLHSKQQHRQLKHRQPFILKYQHYSLEEQQPAQQQGRIDRPQQRRAQHGEYYPPLQKNQFQSSPGNMRARGIHHRKAHNSPSLLEDKENVRVPHPNVVGRESPRRVLPSKHQVINPVKLAEQILLKGTSLKQEPRQWGNQFRQYWDYEDKPNVRPQSRGLGSNRQRPESRGQSNKCRGEGSSPYRQRVEAPSSKYRAEPNNRHRSQSRDYRADREHREYRGEWEHRGEHQEYRREREQREYRGEWDNNRQRKFWNDGGGRSGRNVPSAKSLQPRQDYRRPSPPQGFREKSSSSNRLQGAGLVDWLRVRMPTVGTRIAQNSLKRVSSYSRPDSVHRPRR